MMTVNVQLRETVRQLSNFKNALDASSIVAITDVHGVISYVNDKFCELSHYTKEELIGQTHQFLSSEQTLPIFDEICSIVSSNKLWQGEMKNRAKDGSYYWTDTTVVPFLNDVGELEQYIFIHHDISSRIEAENSVEKALHNDFQQAIKQLQNCIFKVQKDEKNHITFVFSEGKLAENLKLTTEFVTGLTPEQAIPTDSGILLAQKLKEAFQGNFVNFKIALDHYYFFVNLSPFYRNGSIKEVVGSVIDITLQQENEQTISQLEFYDHLTSLPNRSKLKLLLKEELMRAKAENYSSALLFIDLDRFKRINEMFGHDIGDELLIQIAGRLTNNIGPTNIAARLSGDEFVVFLKKANAQEAKNIAEKLITCISEKLTIQHVETTITPSIGISLFPKDSDDVDSLIITAESAMYFAKNKGKNTFRFFDDELQKTLVDRLLLETALNEALEKNQFSLHYQPKIHSITGKIVGAEALLRWYHPMLGNVSPMDFIPIAEETNDIIPIGEWVLDESIKQLKKWQENGLRDFILSINVAVKQLTGSDFITTLQQTLQHYHVDPATVQIEITESAMMNIEETLKVINGMKEIGVTIAIDDFGTGYSSLKYLRHLPIDVLKIDQSFVRELSNVNKSIIKTVINLAENMNLNVIAEGVESMEHVTFLQEHRCTEMQGYYFSKPLPLEQFEEFLGTWESQEGRFSRLIYEPKADSY